MGGLPAEGRIGNALSWRFAAREADYLGSKWSLVCQRVRAGSSRLDEIDDELDWDAVPGQVLRIHLWPRMHLVLGPARNR